LLLPIFQTILKHIQKIDKIVIKPMINVIKGFSSIIDFILTLKQLKNPITIAPTTFTG
jgi:hypothetical protein